MDGERYAGKVLGENPAVSGFSQRTGLVLCLVLLLAATTTAGEPETGWTEVTTAHFRLKTSLNPEAARQAVILAESSRAALLAAAWPRWKLLEDRLELVVFSDHQDFVGYFGTGVESQLVLGSESPTVYLFGNTDRWQTSPYIGSEERTSVLMQSLARYLAGLFYPRQPMCFATGLAEFLATVKVSPDGRTATIGHKNYGASASYRSFRTATAADALAWGTTLKPSDQVTLASLNGLCWQLVAWMYNTRRPEFLRLEQLLRTTVDPRKAWDAVFPGLDLGELDRELYRFSEPFQVSTASIPEDRYPIESEHPMTPAEVHATRGNAALAASHLKDAVAEVAAALADDPGNTMALRALRTAAWDAPSLDRLASTLAARKRCSDAIPTEERAVAKASAAERETYTARLAAITRSCAVAQPPRVMLRLRVFQREQLFNNEYRFVLYDSGLLIAQRPSAEQLAEYFSVQLGPKERDSFLEGLQLDDFFKLADESTATSSGLPSAKIAALDSRTGKLREVSLSPFDETASVPSAFVRIFRALMSYASPRAAPWFPDFVYLIVTKAAEPTPCVWPRDWEDLESFGSMAMPDRPQTTTEQLGIIRAKGDRLTDIQRLLRKCRQTVTLNGRPVFLKLALTLPHEREGR